MVQTWLLQYAFLRKDLEGFAQKHCAGANGLPGVPEKLGANRECSVSKLP
jgi:hypothetical protein